MTTTDKTPAPTLAITIAARPITVTTKGIDRIVDPSTFHSNAVAAIFAYGLRRWFQDNINSAAKVARDAEADFDLEASFLERLEQATSGDIAARSTSTLDPMTDWRRKAVTALARRNPALRDNLKALASVAEKNAYRDDVAAKNAKLIDKLANELRAEAERQAAKATDLADELTIS